MTNTARDLYENYSDLLKKLGSLASTVSTIYHAMEYERVSQQILDTYVTIYDAINGILRSVSKEQASITQFIAKKEKSTGRISLPVLHYFYDVPQSVYLFIIQSLSIQWWR